MPKTRSPSETAQDRAVEKSGSSLDSTPVCGFIGLGDMGRPMARRIADAGLPLRLWARRPASLDGLLVHGVEACASPRALGMACDVVGLCVRTDEEVLDVALREPDGLLGGMRPGSALLVHATVLPRTIQTLDVAARRHGVHLLDAPVSGGAKGAAAGSLTVLLGGNAEAVTLVQPFVRSFGKNVPHVGEAGAAQILKLINNNLAYANVAMSIAALDLAAALGVDSMMAAQVMNSSSGASHGMGLIMDRTSVAKMTGPTSNIRKDVAHLVEVMAQKGTPATLLTEVSLTTATRVAAYAAGGAIGAS